MKNLVLRATCFAQSLAAVAKDRRGVTAMEYGLIAALIAVILVVAVPILAGGIGETFTNIGTLLSTKAGEIVVVE
jgi:pilus assembly protein Flp/PilA